MAVKKLEYNTSHCILAGNCNFTRDSVSDRSSVFMEENLESYDVIKMSASLLSFLEFIKQIIRRKSNFTFNW